MPARKPSSLITRHETKAETRARVQREASMRSNRSLPMEAPAYLATHKVAAAAWRRLMREYTALEGELVTRLDMDLLIDYCILIEQMSELDEMRNAAFQVWRDLNEKYETLKSEGHTEQAVLLSGKVVDAFSAVVKLDARADQKRKSLLQLRQSLYLTPRSRAGVTPAGKEEETPPDDLEQLLNDVSNFVNGSDAE